MNTQRERTCIAVGAVLVTMLIAGCAGRIPPVAVGMSWLTYNEQVKTDGSQTHIDALQETGDQVIVRYKTFRGFGGGYELTTLYVDKASGEIVDFWKRFSQY